MAVGIVLAGCSKVGGIDSSLGSPISNDDTYAALDGIWSGAQLAITAKKEPLASPFTLPLRYDIVCPSSGQRSYQGTLTGSYASGSGSATVALTGTLTNCAFDNKVRITTVTAASVTVAGTIAITSDAYGATNLRLTASGVTVNGVVCPGGIDVAVAGPTPSSQPTSTGTACGRLGSVLLP